MPDPQNPASYPASQPGQPSQAAARWPWLVSRFQVRHRFAALGVVGVLVCALPLLQVLRYQGAMLDAKIEDGQRKENPEDPTSGPRRGWRAGGSHGKS